MKVLFKAWVSAPEIHQAFRSMNVADGDVRITDIIDATRFFFNRGLNVMIRHKNPRQILRKGQEDFDAFLYVDTERFQVR